MGTPVTRDEGQIHRRSVWDDIRSTLATARATPVGENQGNPLKATINDALSLVPMPSDAVDAMRLAHRFATDPTALGQLGIPIAKSVAQGAVEHPLATMASIAPAELATKAYRAFTPFEARAYLHQFYGGGNPLTEINPSTAVDFRAVAGEHMDAAMEMRRMRVLQQQHARLSNRIVDLLQQYRRTGISESQLPKSAVDRLETLREASRQIEAKYLEADIATYPTAHNLEKGQPHIRSSELPQEALDIAGLGPREKLMYYTQQNPALRADMETDYPRAWNLGLGKTFITLDKRGTPTGVRDLYKFYPEVYGWPPPRGPVGSDWEGKAHAAYELRNILALAKHEPLMAARRVAIKYGTPYPINIPFNTTPPSTNLDDLTRALDVLSNISGAETRRKK